MLTNSATPHVDVGLLPIIQNNKNHLRALYPFTATPAIVHYSPLPATSSSLCRDVSDASHKILQRSATLPGGPLNQKVLYHWMGC